MPKMKTNSGAAKRFSFTATGKIKKNRAKRRHILTSKTTKAKRQRRKATVVHPAQHKQVKKLMPYGV
jgi:large subunit ribosomal protein L35